MWFKVDIRPKDTMRKKKEKFWQPFFLFTYCILIVLFPLLIL